jgi:ribosomal-protein-alanine N-acetyltransferase
MVSSRGSVTVGGAQLRLRFAVAADDRALFELARDPEVTRFFSWGPYREIGQAQAYIARLAEQRRKGTKLDFVIDHVEAGVIGVTGLSEIFQRDRRAVVGTWLGKAWWGSGANAESKALLAHLAFRSLGLQRLGAYCHPDHLRSAAALERVGFTREGLLRGYHRHANRQLDVIAWSLLRTEWEASKLAQLAVRTAGHIPSAFSWSD